jgi:hypothetical protein
LNILGRYLPYNGTLGNMQCLYWGFTTDGCLVDGKALLAPEFDHWKRKQRAANAPVSVDPHPGNTVLAVGHGADVKSDKFVEEILELDAGEVVRELAGVQELPVLYLAHPVHLAWGAGTHDKER